MKRLLLALMGMLALSAPAIAIQQFQSDTTHEIGINTNGDIFFRSPSTGPVTLGTLAVPATYISTNSAGIVISTTVTNSAPQVATSETLSAFQIFQPTNFTLVFATNTLPAVGSYETFTSSGVNLLMTGTPTLSTTTITTLGPTSNATNLTDGSFIILSSTSTQTFTLQDNSTLAGSLLLLGSNTRIIGNHKTIGLVFNNSLGKWTEVFYANNN